MSVIIDGSAGVTTNTGAVYNSIQSGTSVTASGTSIDFTSIPSWVRRITVMFQGVSTSGTSNLQIRIGSGSFVTSGYTSSAGSIDGTNTTSTTQATSGFIIRTSVVAASSYSGISSLSLITGNTFVHNSQIMSTSGNGIFTLGNGFLALGGALDRVQVTTVNGTDTFDAGTINILYE